MHGFFGEGAPFLDRVRFSKYLAVDHGRIIVNEPKLVNSDKVILLGSIDDEFEKPLTLPVDDFLRHALIVGSTGSGKTTTAAVIASQLVKYGNVVIVDWNDEYSKILKTLGSNDIMVNDDVKIPLRFNDFEEFISILNDVLELSDAQTYLLYRFLDDVGRDELTIQDLIDYLEGMQAESKWIVETKSALMRRLRLIYNSKTKDLYQDLYPSEVLGLTCGWKNDVYVFSLRRFRDIKLRRLAILALIKLVEDLKETSNTLNNVFVFIDEAHHVANSSLINRLVAEVRKLGIGLILITQTPSAIGNTILANCNVKIVHTVKSNSDIDVIVKSLGVNELREVLPRLNVGEVVVDSPSLQRIIRAKIETNPRKI
ncbi:MAG: ATP-binding protein [Sulfolobales archaeon]